MRGKQTFVDRFGPRAFLVWAGVALGVGFLATPAKFLAPSLSLSVALDVGRQTFRLYNRVEIVLALGLVIAGLWSGAKTRWFARLAAPVAIVAVEALWLLPALDVRTVAVMTGAVAPRPYLHDLYIGAEAVKALWLLGFGFAGAGDAPAMGELTIERLGR